MASLSHFLVTVFLVLACGAIELQRNLSESEMVMEEEELLGLFDVMGSLLDEPGWAEVHPQPCTDTPWPGIDCKMGQDSQIFHVTAIHVGTDVASPPCKPSAKLSDSLLNLSYLRTLSIFNCFVTSPVTLSPALFGALSSLEHLSLQSNPSLYGEIPRSLSKISRLRILRLSQNNLHGNIPRELGGSLVNLEQLDLSCNNLSGEIPEEIVGLKSLTILDLSSNGLGGPVPSSLGKRQLLQKVNLCSNRIDGSIPSELGKLNRLVLLDLSHNFINGPIPETLSGLEQLQYLIFDYNPINSLIPLVVGSLRSLKSISFSGCGLTGPIPNSLSSLKNLTALCLDNNSLTGTIPPNLGSLPNLDQLNLSNNKLSGELVLSQEFIMRLGNRLDVRGNSRLCTSYQIYSKNISAYLQTPACLGTQGLVDNRTFSEEQPDNDFKGRKRSWYQGQMSSRAHFHDPHFISACFVLFYMLSIL